jgi:uncharacterized membrane protein YecN with MAPEG domain
MIKALLLIFDPIATWDGIIRARRGMVSILVAYLLPMLLLVSACEAYGLIHWGKMQGDGLLSKLKQMEHQVPRLKKFSGSEAVVVETAQLLLSLAVVFAGAKMVKAIGETFRGRHTFSQAFTVVAYGLSPLFLLRLFDAFTGVSPWATWAIGIILCTATLYHGVPRIMEPDPSHAFGFFLMSALLLALVTALARFVTASYLEGEFPRLQAIVSDLIARLPF